MAGRGSFPPRRRKGGAGWARQVAGEALNPIRFVQFGVGALSPSARHCRGHAIGRSMRRLTPKPRGRRPSIAALTMGGATKASDSVMRIALRLAFSGGERFDGLTGISCELIQPAMGVA